MLEVKNLSFAVHGKKILRDVSVSFPQGKLSVILGPNGSGKSTLLSFLGRERICSHRVFLAGRDVAEIPDPAYARLVSMMTQRQEGTADFRVSHAVLMGRFPCKGRYDDYSEEDVRIAGESMAAAGILALKDRSLLALSGGELQRVRIARAFAQRASVMLFDEPTNHLDVKHKLFFLNRLKEESATSICVLHDISLAARFSEFLVVMKAGRCVAKGPTRSVLSGALLEDVFEVPFVSFQSGGISYWNY